MWVVRLERHLEIMISKVQKKTIAKIVAWYFALCNRYNFEADNIIL